MATGLFFVITDGVVTCTFADGSLPSGATSYAIVSNSWAPAIAALSQSQLGGKGPYSDVVEDIPISILGASVPALLANAAALNRLIEQAERFSRGENVAPVLVKYSPPGGTVSSAAAPLQAMILGLAGAGPAVVLPATFDQTLGQLIVANARLRFVRRGAWLLSTPVTAGSAAVVNPGPYPITGMTTHPNISPAVVSLKDFDTVSYPDTLDSKPILLLAQQNSDLQISEAEVGTATAYTSVADATLHARGGSVLRYTPTGTAEAVSGEIALAGITASARRFAFFAALRNNSATTTWKIRVGGLTRVKGSGPVNKIAAYTRLVAIDAAHTRPRYVPLGVIAVPEQLRSLQLAITASAVSGSLDVDYIIALAVDNPYARAIQLDSIEAVPYSAALAFDLTVDPQPLTALTPLVYRAFQSTSDRDYLGYFGDSYPVASGSTFTAAIMCKRAQDPTHWVYLDAGAAPDAQTLVVSRLNAYLSPE